MISVTSAYELALMEMHHSTGRLYRSDTPSIDLIPFVL